MLAFRPVGLEDKALVDSYMYPYGEGSCQHSFTAMYCMDSKYRDSICLSGGYLFTLRAGKSTDNEWCCLFPMGDTEDKAGLKAALEELLASAYAAGAGVRFETLTAGADELLHELLPGRFVSESCRDMYEYIYTREKLAELPGHEMASKRHDINTFMRDYGERCEVREMRREDIPGVLAFQKVWLEERIHEVEDVQLDCENLAIIKGLAAFEELGLRGIVVFIDGELAGYAYGAPLSEDSFDVLIEKGDRTYPDIYKILNRDLVRLCCDSFTYINREEDVGVEGLRTAKLSYKPDILLEKRIATEVRGK